MPNLDERIPNMDSSSKSSSDKESHKSAHPHSHKSSHSSRSKEKSSGSSSREKKHSDERKESDINNKHDKPGDLHTENSDEAENDKDRTPERETSEGSKHKVDDHSDKSKSRHKEKARERDSDKKSSKRKVEEAEEDDQKNIEENGGFSFEELMNYDTGAPKKKTKLSNTSHKSNRTAQDKTHKTSSSHKHRDKTHSEKDRKHGHKRERESSSSSSKHSSHRDKDSHSSKHSSHRDKGSSSSKHSSHRDKDTNSSKHGSKRPREDKPERDDLKQKNESSFEVPSPTKQVMMTHEDILSSLPETQPHYKPLPQVALADKLPKDMEDGETAIGFKKYSRTQVYSGKKNRTLSAVPTLYDACMRVLIDNVDYLDYVGGVPAEILMPVLKSCTPTQLLDLEECNSHFVGDTEDLWKKHCERDFRGSEPDEFESWRELYLNKMDERERRLQSLTANIKGSMDKKKPVRQTKLAYVDVAAKAPRGVRRKQVKFGTAGPQQIDPLSKLTSRGAQPVPKTPAASVSASSQSVSQRQQQKQVRIAPMMAKAMKFMKNMRRK